MQQSLTWRNEAEPAAREQLAVVALDVLARPDRDAVPLPPLLFTRQFVQRLAGHASHILQWAILGISRPSCASCRQGQQAANTSFACMQMLEGVAHTAHFAAMKCMPAGCPCCSARPGSGPRLLRMGTSMGFADPHLADIVHKKRILGRLQGAQCVPPLNSSWMSRGRGWLPAMGDWWMKSAGCFSVGITRSCMHI